MAVLRLLDLVRAVARPLRAPHSIRLRNQRRRGDEQAGIERRHSTHPRIVEMFRRVDDSLNLGAVGLNQRPSRLYRDLGADRADFETRIDSPDLAGSENDLIRDPSL